MRKALLYTCLFVSTLSSCSSSSSLSPESTPTEKKSCIDTVEQIDAKSAPYQYIATFEHCNEHKSDPLIQEYIFSLITIGAFEKLNSPSLLNGNASDEQKKYWQALLKDNL
ncbi:hypothetical protein [uncultured Shewanella sp.]|uniref:hypothetical protein n=1 Tax=uncultured Shewanella sp. TaxID=173975 RepID=UPI002637BE6F|nr:hypothetical protein [uncultured Shewanella sp.]